MHKDKVPSYMAFLTAVIAVAPASWGQSVLYVDSDATGANDGSSWCDAFVHLQDALAAAVAPGATITEIRVAEGVYRPDRGTNRTGGDRDAVFRLINGVALLGGYAGCGAVDPNERDADAHETILNGDLAGNDEPGFENNDENAYHVVKGSGTNSTAAIDGFVITAGNANGVYPDASGAGIYNYQGSPTVTRCTVAGNWADVVGAAMYNGVGSDPEVSDCAFRDNKATWGAGMYNWDSNPTLTRCRFSRNRTTARDGGGIYNTGSHPVLVDCTFTDNLASSGGGIANYENSSPILTNCRFVDNRVHWSGGGMFNTDGSNPILVDCIFHDNRGSEGTGMRNTRSSPELSNCIFTENISYARGGGAMYNDNASPTLTNCLFSKNEARFIAGAMYNDDDSRPLVIGCTFLENTAFLGGAVYNKDSSPTLAGCIFSGNTAENDGGGMYNDESGPSLTSCMFAANSAFTGGGMLNFGSSRTEITNCTFVNNAANYGGGIYSFASYHTAVNCIFWGNTDANGSGESAQVDGAWALITYSCIQGWQDWPWGVGNHGNDPLFVPGPAGCYYLSQTTAGQAVDSPCVDAGSDTAASLGLDVLTTRSDEVTDTGIVDMGYHYPITGRLLVMGDYDRDLDIDLKDFMRLQSCFTGRTDLEVSPCCRIFEFEPDGDVDLDDFSQFGMALIGP
ncbi:MAG: hypothetical protein JSU86_20200 [Phycisphaerales bacterium]|nr:MAG: hypothetical protein JSU86_20200 [Phycisphaerales bacterium]